MLISACAEMTPRGPSSRADGPKGLHRDRTRTIPTHTQRHTHTQTRSHTGSRSHNTHTHTRTHARARTHTLTGRPASRPASSPGGCAAGPRCPSVAPSSAPPAASPRSPEGRAVLRPRMQRETPSGLTADPQLTSRKGPGLGALQSDLGSATCQLCGPRAGYLTLRCRFLHRKLGSQRIALG